jgi:HAD superfamily phosphatase (TIGR01681 family)
MLGDLLPADDLRDFAYFVSRLNEHLSQVVRGLPNCHLLDTDRLASIYGRRFVQDDTLWIASYGGFLTDYDQALDQGRLEYSLPASAHFGLEVLPFIRVLWAQVHLMLRVIRGTDAVKMVCVDLDDTMWRGVIAERQEWDHEVTSGWPLGLMEALVTLRRRGIILAIVSKNDPATIAKIWPDVLGNWILMDSFAIHKIGWGSKAESVREAIEEANILPESVVFIDDNPVERAAVSGALPGMFLVGHISIGAVFCFGVRRRRCNGSLMSPPTATT